MPAAWRQLQPGQSARLSIYDMASGESRTMFETPDAVIEAPNWSADGTQIYFNRDGLIYRVPSGSSATDPDGARQGPQLVPTGRVSDANNDHVLSQDGRFIYLSSGDGHIYEISLDPGHAETDLARRVSNVHAIPFRYFLHGISPDGQMLAYTGAQEVDGDAFGLLNIFTIPVKGGDDVQLTRSDKPNDGPEFSPDGQWIYFNSEMLSSEPGHAQIFRMHTDGSDLEQLTFDERVNWFPHLSPDGSTMVYLSYPPGTKGHPADKQVALCQMSPEGGKGRVLRELLGGQGTINVNSWAPDGKRFAFVEYPL